MKIVVVEDEPRIASFLSKGLKAEGYAVHHAMNGRDGLSLVMNGGVDLMVLDLGLPDMDGSEVLRKLRQVGEQLPVIILTARGEIADRVEGLELGADDYMTKPFAFDELLARIRARLRPRGDHGAVLRVGDLKLDTRTRRAIAAGQEVDLSAREFALLETFSAIPARCCHELNCSLGSGDSTSIRARTSWTSTSAICDGNSGADCSKRFAAADTACWRRPSPEPAAPFGARWD